MGYSKIMESGSTGTIPFYNASRRNEAWLNFTAGVSECTDAAEGDSFSCLQSASTSELIASWAQAATTLTLTGGSNLFVPVIDGDVIPDLPSKLFAAGKFSKIPFMAGTVLDEGACQTLFFQRMETNACTFRHVLRPTDRRVARRTRLPLLHRRATVRQHLRAPLRVPDGSRHAAHALPRRPRSGLAIRDGQRDVRAEQPVQARVRAAR